MHYSQKVCLSNEISEQYCSIELYVSVKLLVVKLLS